MMKSGGQSLADGGILLMAKSGVQSLGDGEVGVVYLHSHFSAHMLQKRTKDGGVCKISVWPISC